MRILAAPPPASVLKGRWILARHEVSGSPPGTESVLKGRWKSGVPSGRGLFAGALPATSWLANFLGVASRLSMVWATFSATHSATSLLPVPQAMMAETRSCFCSAGSKASRASVWGGCDDFFGAPNAASAGRQSCRAVLHTCSIGEHSCVACRPASSLNVLGCSGVLHACPVSEHAGNASGPA